MRLLSVIYGLTLYIEMSGNFASSSKTIILVTVKYIFLLIS